MFMKRIFSLILIAAACTISEAQETKSTWSRYTVEGEEFSVLLPTLPAMTTTRGRRGSDHERRVQRQLETSADGLLYTIEVYQNPEPRQSLEAFILEHTDDVKCDPASEKNLTVDGYFGKECSSPDKIYPAIVQFFATETRLYRFLVRAPGVVGPAAREFFSSIRLGKVADGIKVTDGPGDRIYSGKSTTEKARMLDKPEPSYTEQARANSTTGTVILRVVFTRTGTVENIQVIRGLPDGLTEKAIEAAKQIKFVPATKDGHPVSMWMQLEYTFLP